MSDKSHAVPDEAAGNAEQTRAGRAGFTRRDALRAAALALTASGLSARLEPAFTSGLLAAVRQESAGETGYEPALFHPHEWRTLVRLCELIVPADEHSGSAVDAGAPELIDLLASHNEELARIFTSGILWIDSEMRRREAPSFAEATPEAQAAILDELAAASEEPEPGYESYEPSPEYAGFLDYTVAPSSPVGSGVPFFQWVRRLTVDAFYASPEGVKDLDYRGNGSQTEYTVPEEAIRWALERSPFRG
jgi:hypothetical protein